MDIFEQVAEMRADEREQATREDIVKNLLTDTDLSLAQVHKVKENLLRKITSR